MHSDCPPIECGTITIMRVFVIIAAAGASSRFGGDRSKLALDLGGKSVLQRSVELFKDHAEVANIFVAGPIADDAFERFRAQHGDMLALLGATLGRGGESHRWETVQSALAHAPEDATHIAVHDAARPGAPAAMITRVFKAAAMHDAVLPGINVADTLKRVTSDIEHLGEVDPMKAALLGEAASGLTARVVEKTVPRDRLVAAQTPQVFGSDLLRRAYAQNDLASTDDASLVERLGERVLVVEGDPRAMKITRPADVQLLMAMLGLRPPRDRAAHKRF